MKKKFLLLMGIFSFGILLHAQVGINTQNPQGIFHIDAKANNSTTPTAAELADDIIVDIDGKVGLGMIPEAADDSKLQINGSVTVQDGNEAAGKVFISDTNGTGTWQPYKISYQSLALTTMGTGVNIPYNLGANVFKYTGTYMTLPPGRYVVNVYMILAAGDASGTTTTAPTNSYLLLRTTFSDSNTTLARSADIEGAYFISGILPGAAVYAQLSGSVFINNTSGSNKTYYYIAGWPISEGNTGTIRSFGAGFFPGYNSIIIYKLED